MSCHATGCATCNERDAITAFPLQLDVLCHGHIGSMPAPCQAKPSTSPAFTACSIHSDTKLHRMPNATKKRSRSEVSDNINPSSPKRFRLALVSTAELLTPHSVPLSPTGAGIWSVAVDLATVNQRLLEYTQALDSTSDVDSLEEWRRQYATDDESSPSAGSRARWDTPDGNGERSTPVTMYGSDNSNSSNCAPQEQVSANKHHETAPSEPLKSRDDRQQHSYRQE